jgi:hypothetical protein
MNISDMSTANYTHNLSRLVAMLHTSFNDLYKTCHVSPVALSAL